MSSGHEPGSPAEIERLATLSRTELLDSEPEESFDRLTRLASRVLAAPISLLSLVDDERQFFKSALGLPEPWATSRGTPLLLSFCQYAMRSSDALLVRDARRDPRFTGHPAIGTLGVIAYLGIPLALSDGQALGALCVIDRRPRRWSPEQVRVLRDLAASAISEIELRLQIDNVARARSASQDSELRLRLLLESTGEGIYGVDNEGRCTFSNRAAGEMLGYAPAELVGRNMHELIHHSYPDGRPYPVEACRVYHAFRTGESTHVEDEALWRADGSRFDAEYWAYPVVDDGRVDGAVVTFRDITVRKRNAATLEHYTRRLEESDRRKDEFLAVLGHELRNPLAAISATAELLALESGEEDSAGLAGTTIAEQVGQLTTLLDDLLDVSRITQGKIRLRRRTSPVRTAFDRAIASAKPLIESRGHRLVVDVEEALHATLDPTRLEQILVNLFTNAAKYTEPGGRIEARSWASERDLLIRVTDNGRGIDARQQDAIFEPFHQAGSGESYQGGLGVGLTLVKRLVELHGGAISLESAGEGTGSSFTIVIPGAVSDPPEPGRSSPDDGVSQPEARPRIPQRILVIDDNREAADGIVRLLRSDGFDALAVYRGIDALERVRTIHFDAMLVDIALPDISGYEIAKRVRADPERAGMMLVALSGFGHAEARSTAKAAGFDHHVAKPATLAVLRALLAGHTSAA